MGRLSAYFFSRFRTWERPAQMAMVTALVLLAVTIIFLVIGGQPLRQPTLIGIIGLLIAVQAIFMWANRSMVTPYTQAQRLYLAGDIDAARDILENIIGQGKADVHVLTLLGNTYRQLGLLEKSAEVLTKAVQLRPLDHFPLYGFGRTLMVMGNYTGAADVIQRALEGGASPVIRVDLAEAYFRSGIDRAAAVLDGLDTAHLEPHRALMMIYILYRLGSVNPPSSSDVREGLAYWQDAAIRFRHTPYGQALADDVAAMRAFLKE
ncbi:MAG: tetratricopeptide repeat protein [Anaerolineae bacterium]|nr:tetratricopeptide repeat protein [Anaerolineae bacterium]